MCFQGQTRPCLSSSSVFSAENWKSISAIGKWLSSSWTGLLGPILHRCKHRIAPLLLLLLLLSAASVSRALSTLREADALHKHHEELFWVCEQYRARVHSGLPESGLHWDKMLSICPVCFVPWFLTFKKIHFLDEVHLRRLRDCHVMLSLNVWKWRPFYVSFLVCSGNEQIQEVGTRRE